MPIGSVTHTKDQVPQSTVLLFSYSVSLYFSIFTNSKNSLTFRWNFAFILKILCAGDLGGSVN